MDRSDEVDFDIVQYNTLKVLIRDEKTHDGYELNSEVLNYLFQTNISIDLVNGLFGQFGYRILYFLISRARKE